MDKFDVILCDVPWNYRDNANAGERGAAHKYPCLTLEELQGLDVAAVAADNCSLFMWTTSPMVKDCIELMEHWGFKYSIVPFTWIKKTKHGKLHWGMGGTTRANPEFVLLGRRGSKAVKRISAAVHSVVITEAGRHSSKPEEVQLRIEKLYGPDVKRLELFARRERPGWTCIGFDLDTDVFDFLPHCKIENQL